MASEQLKRFECDVCGHSTDCESGVDLPMDWGRMELEQYVPYFGADFKKRDLCPDCLRKVNSAISVQH